MNNELQKLDEAVRILAECNSLDKAKKILDMAEAARYYAKMEGLSTETVNHGAEIKLRAQRKLGEILASSEKQNGGDGKRKSLAISTDRELPPTLSDLGISYSQSSRWQQIASVPESTFEQHIADTKAQGEELTSASVLRLAKEINGEIDPETGEILPMSKGRQKPKINRVGDQYVPQGFDACQTPAYAVDPLLPYLDSHWSVWEPACGEQLLVEALYDSGFKTVIGTDLLSGTNFFDFEPAHQWDCIVTNPPYSIKYPWLERCYALEKPFALLLPVETLGAKTAQIFFRSKGLEIVFLDQRINFKMPNIGFEGSSAQFPVAWFTWGLNIGQQMTFAEIVRDD